MIRCRFCSNCGLCSLRINNRERTSQQHFSILCPSRFDLGYLKRYNMGVSTTWCCQHRRNGSEAMGRITSNCIYLEQRSNYVLCNIIQRLLQRIQLCFKTLADNLSVWLCEDSILGNLKRLQGIIYYLLRQVPRNWVIGYKQGAYYVSFNIIFRSLNFIISKQTIVIYVPIVVLKLFNGI